MARESIRGPQMTYNRETQPAATFLLLCMASLFLLLDQRTGRGPPTTVQCEAAFDAGSYIVAGPAKIHSARMGAPVRYAFIGARAACLKRTVAFNRCLLTAVAASKTDDATTQIMEKITTNPPGYYW